MTATWAVEQIKRNMVTFFHGRGILSTPCPILCSVFDSHPLSDIHTPDVKSDDCDDLPAAAIKLTEHEVPPPHDWFVRENQWKPAVQAYLAAVSLPMHKSGVCWMLSMRASRRKHHCCPVFRSRFHLGEKIAGPNSLWERSTRCHSSSRFQMDCTLGSVTVG